MEKNKKQNLSFSFKPVVDHIIYKHVHFRWRNCMDEMEMMMMQDSFSALKQCTRMFISWSPKWLKPSWVQLDTIHAQNLKNHADAQLRFFCVPCEFVCSVCWKYSQGSSAQTYNTRAGKLTSRLREKEDSCGQASTAHQRGIAPTASAPQ